jgi:hypothetical protein
LPRTIERSRATYLCRTGRQRVGREHLHEQSRGTGLCRIQIDGAQWQRRLLHPDHARQSPQRRSPRIEPGQRFVIAHRLRAARDDNDPAGRACLGELQ